MISGFFVHACLSAGGSCSPQNRTSICCLAGAGSEAGVDGRQAEAAQHQQARKPLPAKTVRERSTRRAAVQGQAIAGSQCMARPACIASSHQHRGCRTGQQDGSRRMGGVGQKRGLSASTGGDLDGGVGLQLTPGTERQAWKSLRDSHNRKPATADSQQGFLPGLLANSEMAKWSNPALSKPVTRNSPLRLPN